MNVIKLENTKCVTGGFANFAFGGAIGLGMYVWNHRHDLHSMTFKGAALATGSGAITGGIGGKLISAVGGGIVGNVAWRPGLTGLNSSIQHIANRK
ncbi:TPA: hypothetical protein ACK3J3_001358 [Mannheimia haemolytica]